MVGETSLMRERPSDPPTVAAIELDCRRIRLNDAKTQFSITARDYFSLPFREQTLAYSVPPAFTKNP